MMDAKPIPPVSNIPVRPEGLNDDLLLGFAQGDHTKDLITIRYRKRLSHPSSYPRIQ